ncbi:MAG: hypothetical protein RQ751_07645 [Longimicrobiales bacterium]|nr:hypothetical protein [Longimicrobiales bacterium]
MSVPFSTRACLRDAPMLIMALVSSLLAIGPLAAQVGSSPAQAALTFRNLVDVHLLAAAPADGESFTPSLRIALQRRMGLGWSWTVAGLHLQDELSRTTGAAVGGSHTISAGPLLLEPFFEVGAGSTDARVESGRYQVSAPGGEVQTVQRFRSVDGIAALGGFGIGASWISADGIVVRTGLGYWRVQGSDGFDRGSARATVSLGLARRDEIWYSRATDKTPPRALAVGVGPAEGDSVQVLDGRVLLYAADDNGIRRMLVNGLRVDFSDASSDRTVDLGLSGPGAVVADIPVPAPPFEGTPLQIVVEDEGRQVTRLHLDIFGPEDRAPPVVASAEDIPQVTNVGWHLRARARDFAGIADATAGFCSMRVFQPIGPEGLPLGLGATERILAGWGNFPPEIAVQIRDRAGNTGEVMLAPHHSAQNPGGAPPVIVQADAVLGSGVSGDRRSIRVRGRVADPGGGWISRVLVEGEPALLRADPDGPGTVDFHGWLAVRRDAESLSVTAETADGRSVTTRLDLPRDEPRAGARYMVLIGDSEGDESIARLTPVANLLGQPGTPVVVQAGNSPEAAVRVLRGLAGRVRPEDVVWVHLLGELSALLADFGPRLSLGDGSPVPLAFLADLIRRLEAGATLVSAEWQVGRSWQVFPRLVPGQNDEPGCISASQDGWGAVFGLGRTTPERMGSALLGEADRDADGVVRAGELAETLTGTAWSGLSPGDPLISILPLTRTEGGVR